MSQDPKLSVRPRTRTEALPQLSVAAVTTPRPLSFELHIRPMFRALDREHMDFALNLWDFRFDPATGKPDVAFYQQILSRLKQTSPSAVMPPPESDGPWPTEWITLFERWVNAGALRLGLATADPAKFKAVRDPSTGTVDIVAVGKKPTPGYTVWFERYYNPTAIYNEYLPNEFVLYQEQRDPAAGVITDFNADDFFQVPAAATTVVIHDAAGSHVVTVV